METLIFFTILGLLGGLTHTVLVAKRWTDWKRYSTWRHIFIGAIIGFVYFHAWSDWNYPNSVMCFVAGYMGPSFIQNLISRVKR